MNTPSRWFYGLILVFAFVVIGFALGAYIGARCCIPSDAGLAGGAMVLGYGLMGSVAAAIIAVVTARYLAPTRLRAVTLVMGVIGIALAGMLTKVYLDSRAATAEFMAESYANMLKFRAELVIADTDTDYPFESIAFDWRTRNVTAVVDGETRNTDLPGEHAAAMLGALRGVEGVTYRDPFPCAGTLGDVQYTLSMHIPEATGQPSTAELALTEVCLDNYPDLARPAAVAADIFERIEWPD